jgi:hypothetical protein
MIIIHICRNFLNVPTHLVAEKQASNPFALRWSLEAQPRQFVLPRSPSRPVSAMSLSPDDLLGDLSSVPLLDGWDSSMFADSPATSPPNVPAAAAAAPAEQPAGDAPDVTMTEATENAGASNVAIDVPAIVATSSAASSVPAASPSAVLSSPLTHAHITAEPSPIAESPSDDEEAPTGTAIGDEDDAALSASSESDDGQPTPRKRRSSGHVYMDISDDDSANGYDAEEYEAATGRNRLSTAEWLELHHQNGQCLKAAFAGRSAEKMHRAHNFDVVARSVGFP